MRNPGTDNEQVSTSSNAMTMRCQTRCEQMDGELAVLSETIKLINLI